jgi:hypothetical protein
MSMRERDPAAAWRRYKEGSGPLHELTETVARAIHNCDHAQGWDYAKERDQWLAVGSWIAAEAVVAVLPMVVSA